MKQNNALAVLFIALAVVSVAVNGWFLYVTSGDATGNAAATAKACINRPPTINVSQCGSAVELSPYYCVATTHDAYENQSWTWFGGNDSLFNITSGGVMSFFPDYGDRGTYTVELTVTDGSGCANSVRSTSFELFINPYPANDTLNITDTTQTNTTYKFDPVRFTANYSDVNNGSSIAGADCDIHYDYQNLSSLPMTYNASKGLYERYETSGFLQGSYDYNVTCNGFGVGYALITKNSTFNITNRPPYLYADFPNLTIQAGRSVSGYDLNDYFKDNDLDTLTFTDTSTSVIDIDISPLGVVTITPNPTISGNYSVRFRASDGFATNTSNVFIITVLPRTFPPPDSGGGGGGGGATRPPPPFCDPEWDCSEWDECLPTGIQERSCRDLNNCSSVEDRPDLVRDCEYVGTCSDNIKNCHDGICEIGVDCGGPCQACETCYDGIRNQDETGVDCGGVCDACTDNATIPPGTDQPSPIDRIPDDVRRVSYVSFAVALLAMIATILASLYLHKNLFRLVGRWASNLIAPPDEHVSEHAQYLIAVEVAYERHRRGLPRTDFLSVIADRTGELISWVLGVKAEYTFDELRTKAAGSDLSKKQVNHIEKYTKLLETAQYGHDTEVRDHALLHGARKLAEHLSSTEAYTTALEAAKTLPVQVKNRLLTHVSEALDVLIEHDRIHTAQMLIEEADALAEGLKKGDALERYQALRAKVVE